MTTMTDRFEQEDRDDSHRDQGSWKDEREEIGLQNGELGGNGKFLCRVVQPQSISLAIKSMPARRSPNPWDSSPDGEQGGGATAR